jgi:uncharacterized protein YkwD
MPKINKKLAVRSYQKQHGLHHKINKNYGKVYWPYLPVLIISILGISFGLFISGFNQSSKTNTISYASLLTSTNQYRIKNGFSPLSFNQDLSTAAQVQANKIAISNSWSPLNNSQQPAFSLISNQSMNLSSPKENLAYDFKSSNSIVSAWSNNNYLASNLLTTNSNSVGFGVVNATDFMGIKNQKVVVAIFANNNLLPQPTVSNTSQKPANLSGSIRSLAVIRLNSITKNDNIFELYGIAFLMLAIVTIIFSKHTYKVHKWITKGENLVIKHPLIDITLVVAFIILAGAIQTTGYIS